MNLYVGKQCHPEVDKERQDSAVRNLQGASETGILKWLGVKCQDSFPTIC